MKVDMDHESDRTPPPPAPPGLSKKMSEAGHQTKSNTMAIDKQTHQRVTRSSSLSELYFTLKSELLLSIKEDLELKIEIEALKQQFLEAALVLAQYEGVKTYDLDIDKETRERCSLTKHIKNHFTKQSVLRGSPSPKLGRSASRSSSFRSHGKHTHEHYYGTRELSARIHNHLSPGANGADGNNDKHGAKVNARSSDNETDRVNANVNLQSRTHVRDGGTITNRDRLHVPDGQDYVTTADIIAQRDVSYVNVEKLTVPALYRKDVIQNNRSKMNNDSFDKHTDNQKRPFSQQIIKNRTRECQSSDESFSVNVVGNVTPDKHVSHTGQLETLPTHATEKSHHQSAARTLSDPLRTPTDSGKTHQPYLNQLAKMMMPRRGSVHDLLQPKSNAGQRGVLVLYDNQSDSRKKPMSEQSSSSSSNSDIDEDTTIQLDQVSSGSESESHIVEYNDHVASSAAGNHETNHSSNEHSFNIDSNNTSFSTNYEVARIMGALNESQNSQNSSLFHQASMDSSGTSTSILDYEQLVLQNRSSEDEESGIEAGQKPPVPPHTSLNSHAHKEIKNTTEIQEIGCLSNVTNTTISNQNKEVHRTANEFDYDIPSNLVDNVDISFENAELFDLDTEDIDHKNMPTCDEITTLPIDEEEATKSELKLDAVSSSTCETEVECYDLDKEFRPVPSTRTSIRKSTYVNAENKPRKTNRKQSSSRVSTVSSSDECSDPKWTINEFRTGKTGQVLRRLSSSRFSEKSSSFRSETQSSETTSVGEPFTHKELSKTKPERFEMRTTTRPPMCNKNSSSKPKPAPRKLGQLNLIKNSRNTETTLKNTSSLNLELISSKQPPNGVIRLFDNIDTATKNTSRLTLDSKMLKQSQNGLNNHRLSELREDRERHSSTSDLSTADNESVYTWTIQDDSDYQNIEDTFEENFQRIHHVEKDFQRHGSTAQSRVDRLLQQNVCPDHELHMALGEPCTFLMGSDDILSLLPEETDNLEELAALSGESSQLWDDDGSSQVTAFSDSELFSDDDTELIKLAQRRRPSSHDVSSRSPQSYSSGRSSSGVQSSAIFNDAMMVDSSLEAHRSSLADLRAVQTDSSPGSMTLAVPMNSPMVSDSGNASTSSSGIFKHKAKLPKQSTPKKTKKIRFQSPEREEKKTPKKEKPTKELAAKKAKPLKKDVKSAKQETKRDSSKKVNKKADINDNGGLWMGDDDKFGGVYMGDDDDDDQSDVRYGGVYLGDDDDKKQSKTVNNNNYKPSTHEGNHRHVNSEIYRQEDVEMQQRDKKRLLKQKLRQFTNVFSKNDHEADVDLRTMGLL